MGKSPREMFEAIVRNLPEKTGRSVEDWVTVLKSAGPSDKRKRVDWLKRRHKLGHVTAEIVAGLADGSLEMYDDEKKLVADLFGRPRSPRRAIYDAVLAVCAGLPGMRVTACKTYVALARNRQFAQIKPRGASSVDLYLGLDSRDISSDRIEPVRRTLPSRVTLTAASDVDAEVRGWLKEAASRG